MWDALSCDLKLAEAGYKTYFAIDFSEVFRYLHPLLDRLRWKTGPGQYDMFVYEQTALKYLLEQDDIRLIFLKEYLEEYYHHLKRAKDVYSDFKKLEVKALKQSSYVRKVKTILKRGLHADVNPQARKIYQELTESFFHLLAPSEFKRELLDARMAFEDLYQNGKLVYLNQMKDNLSFEGKITPENDEEFEVVLAQINDIRSDYDRLINNETDAKAIIVVKILSNLNKNKKKLVFLMTNTLSIFEVLMTVKISLHLGKKKIETPLTRDLYYYLLQTYYSNQLNNKSMSIDDALEDIERRREVLHYAKNLTNKLIPILLNGRIDIDDVHYNLEHIYKLFMESVGAIESIPEFLLLKEEIIRKVREFDLQTFFDEIDEKLESESLDAQLETVLFSLDDILSHLEKDINSLSEMI